MAEPVFVNVVSGRKQGACLKVRITLKTRALRSLSVLKFLPSAIIDETPHLFRGGWVVFAIFCDFFMLLQTAPSLISYAQGKARSVTIPERVFSWKATIPC